MLALILLTFIFEVHMQTAPSPPFLFGNITRNQMRGKSKAFERPTTTRNDRRRDDKKRTLAIRIVQARFYRKRVHNMNERRLS